MALVTRAGKGAPLTFTEMDANLTGLASGSNMTAPVNLPGPVTVTGNETVTGTLTTNGISNTGNISTTGDISGASFNSGPLAFRNRIINGDMRIDQRNNGAVQTSLASGSVYTVDRWFYLASQSGKFSAQQNAGAVTPPIGYSNYEGLTSTSAYTVLAGDSFNLIQRIEGQNLSDLAWGTASAKTVTLSFWVYSSLTGTFGGAINNNGSTRSYPFSYSIPVANTWTFISIIIPGDTTGTWTLSGTSLGLGVAFGLGVGTTFSGPAGTWAGINYISATGAVSVVSTSGATFYITGVQLERSSVATPFEIRPIGYELLLCQRYYWRINYSVSNAFVNIFQCVATTSCNGIFSFPTTMRIAPGALGISAAANFSAQPAAGGGTVCSVFSTSTNNTTCAIVTWTTTGLVAGNATIIFANTSTAWIDASVEL